jgi:hypothetical protein
MGGGLLQTYSPVQQRFSDKESKESREETGEQSG